MAFGNLKHVHSEKILKDVQFILKLYVLIFMLNLGNFLLENSWVETLKNETFELLFKFFISTGLDTGKLIHKGVFSL